MIQWHSISPCSTFDQFWTECVATIIYCSLFNTVNYSIKNCLWAVDEYIYISLTLQVSHWYCWVVCTGSVSTGSLIQAVQSRRRIMEPFHRWRNLGMLLRGFEMRKRSQGSETFLHLNAEKNEGDAKGGSERESRQGQSSYLGQPGSIHI